MRLALALLLVGAVAAQDVDWIDVPANDALDAFQLARAPVTNAQFAEFLTLALAAGAVEYGAVTNAASADFGAPVARAVGGAYAGQELALLLDDPAADAYLRYDGAQFYVSDSAKAAWPATYVRWYGAWAFADFYGLALPSEAQWEWAAQGARAELAVATADGALSPQQANYGSEAPVPVGSYAANPLGLHDMNGQVWEWTADWFSSSGAGVEPPQDGTAVGESESANFDTRAQRGGSFQDAAEDVHVGSRRGVYGFQSDAATGFRVARALAADEAATDARVLFAAVCAAGQFQTFDSQCEECLPGHYCPEGSDELTPCPAGRYGDAWGLSDAGCSGECAPGFLCPAGSTSAEATPCGDYSVYCPAGAGARRAVDAGHYSAGGGASTTTTTRTEQVECEPGFFCEGGLRFACPAGVLANASALASEACLGECPAGSYCPESALAPVPCPAGRLGNATGLASADCAGACPPGLYCPAGTTEPVPCPAGRYGAEWGLVSDACSSVCVGDTCAPNECPAGSYCPEGSSAPLACDAGTELCPAGSAAPTPVSAGALAAADELQEACPAGHYCPAPDAPAEPCPAGTYNALEGQASADACLPCAAGHYCPDAGAVSATARQCGGAGWVCAEGSAAPEPVAAGNYSAGGAPLQRTHQLFCPAGSWCAGGVRRTCPPGTYGDSEGLASAACSGACAAGYYCPRGSPTATQHICPAGRYGDGGSVDDLCTGMCLEGHYCPAGSSSATEYECGQDAVYCPAGAGSPVDVSVGYHSVGGTPSTRTAQVACVDGDNSLPLPTRGACQYTSLS